MMDARPTMEIDGHDTILALGFFSDGRHLIGGGEEWVARQWRMEDGREVGPPMAIGNNVEAITVSPDCKWIVTGQNRAATVWDAKTHTKVVEFKEHKKEVYSVDVSPDSTRVATGSYDRKVYVWSIQTGECLVGPLEHDYLVAAVRFSPSGDRIAVATCQRESVRIYNSYNGQQLVDIPAKVMSWPTTALAWRGDGQHLFVVGSSDIMYLDASTGSVLSRWPHQIAGGDFHSITLASNDAFLVCSAERSITFWDTTSTQARRIGPILEHASKVRSIALSLDNDYLASGEASGKITVRKLTDILPQSCFTGTGVIRRLQQLLKEREDATQDMKDNFEQRIESVHASLRAQEQRSNTLSKENSSLQVNIEELETQLSDSNGTIKRLESELQRLTKLLDRARDSADQLLHILSSAVSP